MSKYGRMRRITTMIPPSQQGSTVAPRSYAVPYSPRGSIYGEEEIEVLRHLLLESSETLSCGKERASFEAEFADLLGAPYAIAVSSCTVGLELAVHVAGLEPGCAVIATPQSYQATLNPLLSLDVEVRFCDIDHNTLCLDADRLTSLMDSRVRAIVLTHYGGLCADMDRILELADRHGVCVIEDCAHALGSLYRGRTPGTFGHIGVFSFQSMKNISTLGEGGMLVVTRADWATRLRRLVELEPDAEFRVRDTPPSFASSYPRLLRDLNTHSKNAYTHDCVRILRHGTNGTLSEPAAAVGRVQLRKLAELITRRRSIASQIDMGLRGLPGIRLQVEPAGQRHSYHLYTFFVQGLDRNRIAIAVDDAGVEIQQRYFPLHLLPEWRLRGGRLGSCPAAEDLWFSQQINLPIYPSLTADQVDVMTTAVRSAVLGETSRPER
jgi:perosamine synthetase